MQRPQRVEDVASLVREGRRLRIRGAGTWMHAGHAVPDATELHLDAFTGIREYTPGDLTISVGAATTLAELDAVTRAQGQWCPLFPWGDDAGSVGATIATATSGPFAASLGRPRDLLLGLECVDGRGRIVRAGGRVVKNVAGFDLTRLMTGSWGTLAVITELHLRLRARPALLRTFYIEGAAQELRGVLRGPQAILAAQPLSSGALRALGRIADPLGEAWLVCIGGNAAQVAAAEQALRGAARIDEMPDDVWRIVRREMAAESPAQRWPWTALQRRVKSLFDPQNLLNPGLLGDDA